MSESNLKVVACFNLIIKNSGFEETFQHDPGCSNCQLCLMVLEYLNNVSFQEPPDVLAEMLRKNSANLHLKSIFSSSFAVKSKCECGSKFKKPLGGIFQVNVPKLLKKTGFLELLYQSTGFQYECCNKSCKVKKVMSSLVINGEARNVLFSLNWEKKNLKTLLNFIVGLQDQIDVSHLLGKQGILYLEGIIVSNNQTSVYIKMNPCLVYSNMQKNTEIYMDYLLFALIQHSLFPSVLVFTSTPRPSEFSEKIVQYEEKLCEFLKFFTGDVVLQQGICFYCWFTDHSACDDFASRGVWNCSSGHLNAFYNLFCNVCDFPRQTLENVKICMFCGVENYSHYCYVCSAFKQCVECGKNVYRTQSYACFECDVWVNSLECGKCGEEPVRVKCFNCFFQAGKSLCGHNTKGDCLLCLYDYTCGVCYEPIMIFEDKFCWSCKHKLLDGFCINCKHYPARNSLVCSTCVLSNKKCNNGHIITKQSIAYCRSPTVAIGNCDLISRTFCSRCSKANHNCANQVFCCECESKITKLKSFCLLCEGQGGNHSCVENTVCQLCIETLAKCECGSKLTSSDKKCRKCLRIKIPNDRIPKFLNKIMGNQIELGRVCAICEFLNKDSTLFCENCNHYIKSLYKDRSRCKICQMFTSGNYCESCFRCCKCSTCKKDILIGQRLFCKTCSSEIYNRVCITCKILVPLSSLQCYTCTLFNWTCPLNHKNISSESRCLTCNLPNFATCQICTRQEVSSLSSWRSTSINFHPLQNDYYCCLICRKDQNTCICGSRYLKCENICLVCSNSLVD